MKNPLRSLYDWTLAQAAKPYALWMLAVISFAESSVFPIPPEVMMIPMILARPKQWLLIGSVAVGFSVLGGAFGYWIGYALFESLGNQVLAFYHAEDTYHKFTQQMNEWGWVIVSVGGFTPIPYKVITIASGAAHMNFYVFMLASLVSRGARMFLIAFLLKTFGPWIRDKIDRWFGPLSILAVALLVGGFLAIRMLG